MSDQKKHITPEFSRFLEVDEARPGDRFDYSATQEERQALARRLEISSIDDLTLGIHYQPPMVTGTVKADITQACMVSGKPVKSRVEQGFDFVLLDEAPEEDEGQTELVDFEIPRDGCVNVGEVAAQYLSLEINPYPMAEGYEKHLPEGVEVTDEVSQRERTGPFAELRRLKDKG